MASMCRTGINSCPPFPESDIVLAVCRRNVPANNNKYIHLYSIVYTKEYISVIEGTAPGIVLQRCDSPNLSPLCLHTALPARLTEQAGRG